MGDKSFCGHESEFHRMTLSEVKNQIKVYNTLMLDIKLIRENPGVVRSAAKNKNFDPKKIEEAIKLDETYRQLLIEIENLRAKRNTLTKDQIDEGKQVKAKLKKLEPQLKEVEEKLDITLRQIPNIPFDDVPVGKDE